MSIKLYYAPIACSLAPHALLIESGLKFKLEGVKIFEPTRLTDTGAEFYKINPRGAVPAVELEDGTIISQSASILQLIGYLAKLPAMHPAPGTLEYNRLTEALGFGGDLHHAFLPLFNPMWNSDERKKLEMKVDQRMTQLEKWLEASNTDYWLGDDITQADFYVAVVMNWASNLKKDISSYKRCVALMDKVFARPSVKQALKEEGVTSN